MVSLFYFGRINFQPAKTPSMSLWISTLASLDKSIHAKNSALPFDNGRGTANPERILTGDRLAVPLRACRLTMIRL